MNEKRCEECISKNKDICLLCDYHLNGVYNDGKCEIDLNDELIELSLIMAKQTSSFMRDLGYDDILASLYSFTYMLEMGAFSVTDNFVFNNAPKDYKGLFYTRIFAGCGCCRHIADFYRLVMNTLNPEYKAFMVRGYLGPYQEDCNLRRKRSFKEAVKAYLNYYKLYLNYFSGMYSSLNFGNHAVVHVHDKDRVVLLDPMNLFVYNYEGKRRVNLAGGKGFFDICGSIFNEEDDITLNSTLDLFNDEENKRNVSREEILYTFDEVMNFLEHNKDLILDFKRENECFPREAYKLLHERKSLHR